MFTHYAISITIFGIEKGCRKPTHNFVRVADIAVAHETTPLKTLPNGFDLAHAIEQAKAVAKQCNAGMRRLDKVVMNLNDAEIDGNSRCIALLPFHTEVIFQSAQVA